MISLDIALEVAFWNLKKNLQKMLPVLSKGTWQKHLPNPLPDLDLTLDDTSKIELELYYYNPKYCKYMSPVS